MPILLLPHVRASRAARPSCKDKARDWGGDATKSRSRGSDNCVCAFARAAASAAQSGRDRGVAFGQSRVPPPGPSSTYVVGLAPLQYSTSSAPTHRRRKKGGRKGGKNLPCIFTDRKRREEDRRRRGGGKQGRKSEGFFSFPRSSLVLLDSC